MSTAALQRRTTWAASKGSDHTCLDMSQTGARWNGYKLSVLVELPACEARRQLPGGELRTLRAARSNCAWIVSSAHFAIKAPISWSLQVRPRSPIFNSLLHFVTGFDPTPEQGRTRVVYPGRTRVRLAHVIATTGSNPSRTRVELGFDPG